MTTKEIEEYSELIALPIQAVSPPGAERFSALTVLPETTTKEIEEYSGLIALPIQAVPLQEAERFSALIVLPETIIKEGEEYSGLIALPVQVVALTAQAVALLHRLIAPMEEALETVLVDANIIYQKQIESLS